MAPCRVIFRCILIGLLYMTVGCKEPQEIKAAVKAPAEPTNPVNNKDEQDPNSPTGPNSSNPNNSPPTTDTNGNNGPGGTGSSGGGGGNNSTSGVSVAAVVPNAQCGNGIQEVQARASRQCIYDLYGTTTDGPDGPSSLYFFDKNTGVGFLIGTIIEQAVGVERIGAIDFSPDGILYGVGERTSDQKSVLLTIDCATAQATIIGETGVETLGPGTITDVDFDSLGRFYAFFDGSMSPNTLGIINPLTGAFTTIGSAGMAIPSNEIGNGIASAPFPNDSLYHAGSINLSTLDKSTGLATTVDGLDFSAPADSNPRINAMDNDAFVNVTYVAINDTDTLLKNNLDTAPDSSENYVGIIDRSTGTVSFLPLGPQLAPAGLDGLAVNQHYEECDPGAVMLEENTLALPEGTDCTETCVLFESDCSDGEDNDSDGAIDCADPDCQNQSCDDDLACTTDDVCVNSVCVGTPNPCIDDNPCSVDGICLEPSGSCDYSQLEERPNFGDCEVDNSPCTIGKCVDDEGPFCFEQNRSLIPIAENGCKDSNPCTADSCVEFPVFDNECLTDVCTSSSRPDINFEAECVYESLAGSVCQPTGEPCLIGICTMTGSGTPTSPYDVQCLNTQPFNCGNSESTTGICTESGCLDENTHP